jgi:thiaminase (transcriptional activator TenA)
VSLSGELWSGIEGTYRAIVSHPFVTGLTDGSLPAAAFSFYVIQDAVYLRAYARALALVAAKATDPAAIEMFARHAAEAISVERQLHGSLLADLGIDPATATAAEPAPANLAYTSYLLAVTATGSYAEGVGAVLPCYWIYWEVGKHLVQKGSPDPRYQRWIDTYGGEEFGATVREVLAVTDALTVTEAERAAVHRHFQVTARFEWMFWDMGYRQEAWPDLG